MLRSLLILLLFIPVISPAQQKGQALSDSLERLVVVEKSDTAKARLYNRIFNELFGMDHDRALITARMGLAHTRSMKWLKGIGTFQDNIGRFYSESGNYDSAVFYYNAAIQSQQEAGNRKSIALTYNNLGVAAQNIKSDFTTAADYYFKALRIWEEEKDSTQLANTLTNLGSIYLLQQDYQKSLDFNRRALVLREKTGNMQELAVSLQGIGKTYLLLKDTARAMANFRKGLAVSEGNGDLQGMASAWSNISLGYSKDLRAVAAARVKARQLWEDSNPLHPEAIANLGNLGIIYYDIATKDSLRLVLRDSLIPADRDLLLKKAAGYLSAAIELSRQTGNIDNYSFFTGALAEVQEQQADFKNAYYNYRFYRDAQDSLFSQENKNRIASSESRRMLELNQLTLRDQRRMMWVLAAGIFMVAVIGVLLYRQAKARKKSNTELVKLNSELDEANQAKARFFALMSHDLRSPVSRLINYLHLQKNNPGLLSTELKETQDRKITEGAESLLDNLENMLSWSKSQMEKFRPQRAEVDVSLLFDKLRNSFGTYENIRFTFTSKVEAIVLTDFNYLFSILHNLLQNAAEALGSTDWGEVDCLAEFSGNEIRFTVKDNGPGFPVPMLHDDKSEGFVIGNKKGLGMLMVRDMVTAIDGRLEIANTGSGAVACLYLRT
ncbi:MAG: sensor histidine kinase [Chitinophagaceae bacterium]|nr:MAG: sensor histidine kinase [Chitinophagaceae bacterium]